MPQEVGRGYVLLAEGVQENVLDRQEVQLQRESIWNGRKVFVLFVSISYDIIVGGMFGGGTPLMYLATSQSQGVAFVPIIFSTTASMSMLLGSALIGEGTIMPFSGLVAGLAYEGFSGETDGFRRLRMVTSVGAIVGVLISLINDFIRRSGLISLRNSSLTFGWRVIE